MSDATLEDQSEAPVFEAAAIEEEDSDVLMLVAVAMENLRYSECLRP